LVDNWPYHEKCMFLDGTIKDLETERYGSS
jgi:hypothetical protein